MGFWGYQKCCFLSWTCLTGFPPSVSLAKPIKKINIRIYFIYFYSFRGFATSYAHHRVTGSRPYPHQQAQRKTTQPRNGWWGPKRLLPENPSNYPPHFSLNPFNLGSKSLDVCAKDPKYQEFLIANFLIFVQQKHNCLCRWVVFWLHMMFYQLFAKH